MSAKVFVIRTAIALMAVLSFAVHNWTGFEPLKWLGLIFYLICFAMYARALFMSLTQTKRVTADLLVVTVMVVSFLAGQPLSGALVAWFISMGLAISFSSCRLFLCAGARHFSSSTPLIYVQFFNQKF